MYIIENARGKGEHIRYETLENATRAAVCLLEDDPELNTLEVYFEAENGSYVHEKTVTHGPDANWNSVVVVLDPGEKVQAPGYVPRQITDEDAEAYERGSYKRAAVERMIGEWI